MTSGILRDLQEILEIQAQDLKTLVNSPVVITGATGFVGTWLSMSWIYARRQLRGTGRLFVTSRNAERTRQLLEVIDSKCPVDFYSSDIRNCNIFKTYNEAYVIHGATAASAALNATDPKEMLMSNIEGTNVLLNEAAKLRARHIVLLSSGAVYGSQPVDLANLSENWLGGPSTQMTNSAYHEGKRVAELLGRIFQQTEGVPVTAARLFAFLAPFLPTRTHFAAGNFLRDVITSRPIQIKSGGASIRTYQYATDMCCWIWAIAARPGVANCVNVGSADAISISELARKVEKLGGSRSGITILGKDSPGTLSRYVPSIEIAARDFGLSNAVDIDESILRTLEWLRQSAWAG